MTQTGLNSGTLADTLDPVLAEISAWLGRTVTADAAITAVASPVHRAVDAAVQVVRSQDGRDSFVLKTWHQDLLDPVDPTKVFDMTAAAAAIGATPLSRLQLKTTDAVLFDCLPDGWRTARLHEIATEEGLSRLIALKQSLHGMAPLPVDRDVFADINRLAQKSGPWRRGCRPG